ncbi:alpha/beta hydrolase family protein [Nannocystis punicea]|uniref:Prolyl oligopeptidase family protein n=1 Tax=Nannocystis punicea TaxID=2995304 RepID=A0ABY7HGQ4_9BACT|nr:hypothetical protein [Nannocystis poenicansa]WAS98260.1 hypothetical protein O0S08_19130 [Nannocystis poenicansa]
MLSCSGLVPRVCLTLAWLALAGCYSGPSGAIVDESDPPSRPPVSEGPIGGPQLAPLELDALSPDPAPGGVEFDLHVTGAGFTRDSVVVVAGVELPTTFVSGGELHARSGPRKRGDYPVLVRRGDEDSRPLTLAVDRSAPRILVPAEVSVDEDTEVGLFIDVVDVADPKALRVHLLGLPPGATWDEPTRRFLFTPDFTQGGDSWTVTVLAHDGESRVETTFAVVVRDTIQPPWPEVVDTEFLDGSGYVRYTLSQKTDDYLDSPGYAGREFVAKVMVPLDVPPEGVAVRVGLHGFATANPGGTGSSAEIRISPHDPDNTYWWGYATSLPDVEPVAGGAAPDYTMRRVLHLVEYVLRHYPEADPQRVHVYGSSMGGAGAMLLGLLRGRHFAYVDARLGQAIARNHRPGRITQLSGWWGAPELDLDGGGGLSAWDHMDLTRALAESNEARDQFLFLKHGKDDPTIHFGATVLPSPRTGESFYQALQSRGVGHFAVWDEGGHGVADPVLGDSWWSGSWAPINGDEATLRRDRAFPAFSRSSLDDDPGVGVGNGKQDWSANAGFAGEVAVPGDTGWDGAIAGALGRFLRWDGDSVVDTVDRLQFALRVHAGDGADPPAPGYPSEGDRVMAELPAYVDVTPRRTQAFRCRPGERIAWSFGKQHGEVVAGPDGSVTIPALPLTDTWTRLVLRRTVTVIAASH